MITSGATKLFDRKQGIEIIIPCHRHAHVFQTLKTLGYNQAEYETIEQGFIDYDANKQEERFVTREEAKQIAIDNNQILDNNRFVGTLFTEDLW